MDESLMQKKMDMKYILKFSSLYNMSKPENANKVEKYIKAKSLMTSPLGGLYMKRLSDIAGSKSLDAYDCLFCKTNVSQDGILCEGCMSKYSGGKLTFQAVSQPASGTTNSTSEQTGSISGQAAELGKASINSTADISQAASTAVRAGVEKFTEKINELSGGSGKVDLRLRDLFSDVAHHHTTDESEEIFTCGTKTTTPKLSEISTAWPKPWLYTRVFLLFFAAYLIAYFGFKLFANTNLVPGIIFLGSAMVPISILIFIFEVNAPRNISIFKVIQVFLIGGLASIVASLFLFELNDNISSSLIGALIIGLIEETGKILVVAAFVMKIRGRRFVLNGMLYGAAVGAGFQVFESAGYAFNWLLNDGFATMLDTIRTRAILAPGGHVAYAALSGAALILALGDDDFSWKCLLSKKFLILFSFPVLLHAFHDWHMPLKNITVFGIPAVLFIKIAIEWIIILVFLHRGLAEINEISSKAADT